MRPVQTMAYIHKAPEPLEKNSLNFLKTFQASSLKKYLGMKINITIVLRFLKVSKGLQVQLVLKVACSFQVTNG